MFGASPFAGSSPCNRLSFKALLSSNLPTPNFSQTRSQASRNHPALPQQAQQSCHDHHRCRFQEETHPPHRLRGKTKKPHIVRTAASRTHTHDFKRKHRSNLLYIYIYLFIYIIYCVIYSLFQALPCFPPDPWTLTTCHKHPCSSFGKWSHQNSKAHTPWVPQRPPGHGLNRVEA